MTDFFFRKWQNIPRNMALGVEDFTDPFVDAPTTAKLAKSVQR